MQREPSPVISTGRYLTSTNLIWPPACKGPTPNEDRRGNPPMKTRLILSGVLSLCQTMLVDKPPRLSVNSKVQLIPVD